MNAKDIKDAAEKRLAEVEAQLAGLADLMAERAELRRMLGKDQTFVSPTITGTSISIPGLLTSPALTEQGKNKCARCGINFDLVHSCWLPGDPIPMFVFNGEVPDIVCGGPVLPKGTFAGTFAIDPSAAWQAAVEHGIKLDPNAGGWQ